MRIIITVEQMMRLLDNYPPKFPLTINLKGLSKNQQEKLFSKIKEKKQNS